MNCIKMFCILIFCILSTFLGCVQSQSYAIDPCDQPIYTGSCNTSYDAYAFNTTSNQCVVINGACQEYPTTFLSMDDCEIACEDVCNRRVDPGNCTGFAYNRTSGQCEAFDDGVCDENGNYFETEEACEEQCENPCIKRISSGPCLALFPAYGYNQTTEQCQYFEYGGCGGTLNRFDTLEECENTCEAGCDKPIYSGFCVNSRYAYNKWKEQCQHFFFFASCDGNGNHYETLEECEEECEV